MAFQNGVMPHPVGALPYSRMTERLQFKGDDTPAGGRVAPKPHWLSRGNSKVTNPKVQAPSTVLPTVLSPKMGMLQIRGGCAQNYGIWRPLVAQRQDQHKSHSPPAQPNRGDAHSP